MRLALGHIGQRRLTEASPHDKLWGTGLSACDKCASSHDTPDTWCALHLLGQALEHAREIFRQETIKPLCNPILPNAGFHRSHYE